MKRAKVIFILQMKKQIWRDPQVHSVNKAVELDLEPRSVRFQSRCKYIREQSREKRWKEGDLSSSLPWQ